MVMHSLRTSSRLTWYFCWMRSRRFCTAMFFCASSTSRAPRCSCSSVRRRRCSRRRFLARGDLGFLRLLLRQQFGGLRVHLLAVVLQASRSAPRDSWISDSACSLRPTKEESSPRRCSMTWVSSRMRCSSDCCCCWNEAHICSSVASATRLSVSAGVGRVALLAQALQLGGQLRDLLPGRPARALRSSPAWAASAGALLQPFLFLRGQALNLINDRVDLLVQQALGILQRVELAFVRGDGHFLGAQFGLRLLQAGLQLGLLALQRALARG